MYFCIWHDLNTTSNRTILQAYFIYLLTQFETSLHNEIPRALEFLFSTIPTPTYLQYFKRQEEGCVRKCYFCLVFKNSKHEIQKPQQQQLQPQCPFSFTCFWGKIKSKQINPPQNPILFFMHYEILNLCLFMSLDTLF